MLQETVPCIKDAKISTVAILEQASDYIAQLKKTHREQLSELRALVLRQQEYKRKLEEKGQEVQVPDLGTFARRAVDPRYNRQPHMGQGAFGRGLASAVYCLGDGFFVLSWSMFV
jgi:nucleoid DNA-binding protein